MCLKTMKGLQPLHISYYVKPEPKKEEEAETDRVPEEDEVVEDRYHNQVLFWLKLQDMMLDMFLK